MELWEKIIEAIPELNATDDFKSFGIFLKDDADGQGAYIAEWNYSKPLPAGMKVGKN
jgi:hypothetical protein